MSIDNVIRPDHPQWGKLVAIWKQQRKPGYVTLGGRQFRVLTPDDETVLFAPTSSGIDDAYGSNSMENIIQ